MRQKGGYPSPGTQNMEPGTGQFSTPAGEPAHPVQHSVMTASSLGFFLRGVVSPVDLGSNFISSGTIPAALFPVVSAGISSPGLYREILLKAGAKPIGSIMRRAQSATIPLARRYWTLPSKR